MNRETLSYPLTGTTDRDGNAEVYIDGLAGTLQGVHFEPDPVSPFDDSAEIRITIEGTASEPVYHSGMRAFGHESSPAPELDGKRLKVSVTNGGAGRSGMFHLVVDAPAWSAN